LLARRIGSLVIVLATLELCGRSIARGSLLQRATGIGAGAWTIVLVVALAAAIAAARRPAGSKRPILQVFAVLFAAGLALQLQLGARLQSDGFYYYAYLRSITFDRDVDFTNDYRLLGLGDKPHLFEPTPTGHAQSAWTVGPAIVWSPFFAAGHGVAGRLARTRADITADGISFPYRQAVCIAGLFYGLVGCWFCYELTAFLYPRRLSAAVTAAVMAGSFMLWYLVKEPSMTHAPSMAAVAGFVWAWLATRDARTTRQWLLLGALAGFMTLIRWQNALFAVLPLCDALVLIGSTLRASDRAGLIRAVSHGLLFTAAAAIAFLPQMIAWHSIYGRWLAVSPIGPQIRLLHPHLADILWSSRNGLFSTSPVLYCAGAGVAILAYVRPPIGVPALAAVAVMTWFNASIQDWWGSDGFGMRRFDGAIPLFCLGLAALVTAMTAAVRRFPLAAATGVLSLFALWNITLMGAVQSGAVRLGEAVSFGDAAAAQVSVFHRWLGMPSTYPASLLFAARNRLSPGAYDLLSPNRFLADPARQYGRIDVGFGDELLVGGGWHAQERDGATTFRWTSARAVALLPLDHAAPLNVQIRAHAFAYPGASPSAVVVFVNDVSAAAFEAGPDWQTFEFQTERQLWRAGVNRIAVEFARTARPVDVGLGGDTRLLGGAVDFIRVQVIDGPR